MRTADPPSSREHSGIRNRSSETLGAAACEPGCPFTCPPGTNAAL